MHNITGSVGLKIMQRGVSDSITRVHLLLGQFVSLSALSLH